MLCVCVHTSVFVQACACMCACVFVQASSRACVRARASFHPEFQNVVWRTINFARCRIHRSKSDSTEQEEHRNSTETRSSRSGRDLATSGENQFRSS